MSVSPGPVLFLLACTAASPAQTRLRHDLTAGATFHYAITIDASFEQARAEQLARFGMHIVLHLAATPGAERDGKTAVPHLVHRLEARTDMPMARVDYDSERDGSTPGALANLAQLVGKTFVVHVDATGALGRVEAPADLDPKATQELATGDLDTLFGQYFVPLPATPVADGGTWENTVKMFNPKLAGDGDVQVTSKLLRVEAGRAVIERQFAIDPSRTPKAAGTTVTVDKAEGQVLLDVATGRLAGAVMQLASTVKQRDQRVSSSVRVTVNPEAAPAAKAAAPATTGR